MTKEVSMLGKLIIKDGKTGLAAPLVSKLSDDVKTQGNAVRYEYFIAGNEVHLFEAYADSDGWERHVDRFLENYADEFLTIFEPNQMFAYGPVSQKLKEKIKDKKAVHSSLGAAAFVDAYKGMEGNGNLDEYSNIHPIVRTHPETGKKILYVNSMYTKRIEGLDESESNKLLKKLFAQQERLDLTCRFKWTENAVAIWDNRSTQHQGLTDFFPGRGLGHERVMDRIAIEGDQPI